MAFIIKLKSLKEQTEDSDGLRVLIARHRPRYLSKDKENWHQWWKDLAPSRDLLKEYIKDKKIDWFEYKRRYIQEIKSNTEAVKLLQILSSFIRYNGDIKKFNNMQQLEKKYDLIQEYNVVTFLCHCKDEKYCHRSIVKEIILKYY